MGQITGLYVFAPNTIIRSAYVNFNFSTIQTVYNAHDVAVSGIHNAIAPDRIALLSDVNSVNAIQIQDYTIVRSVGDVLQQFAGRDYTLAELGGRTPAVAYYRFHNAGTTDEVGTYNLTAVNTPTAGTGIMGTSYAATLNGTNQYYTQATLWHTMPTSFFINVWVKLTNGQTGVIQTIFFKRGAVATDFFHGKIDGSGNIVFSTQNNAGSVHLLTASTVMPNGATDWYMLSFTQDTVNGMRLFVNGNLEAQDTAATVLPAGGATTDMTIGALPLGPSLFFGGTIANMEFVSDIIGPVLDTKHIAFLYATEIPLPSAFMGQPFEVSAMLKDGTGVISQTEYIEQERNPVAGANDILIPGGIRNPLDSYKYVGRITI